MSSERSSSCFPELDTAGANEEEKPAIISFEINSLCLCREALEEFVQGRCSSALKHR